MKRRDLTKIQKLMIINAHPVKLGLNTIGGAVALYFLWKHQVLSAILGGGVLVFAGTIMVTMFSGFDPEKIVPTFWGKIFLRFATPLGFIFYLISHLLIPVSFWIHNLYLTILGFIILGCGLLMSGQTFKQHGE